jgi:hypothetical protein
LNFFAWSGIALVVSGLPLGVVLGLRDLDPKPLNAVGWWVVEIIALALSVSIFWTLQSHVYLKLRRVVDDTPENEIWDGSLGKTEGDSRPDKPAAGASDSAATSDVKPSAGPEPAAAADAAESRLPPLLNRMRLAAQQQSVPTEEHSAPPETAPEQAAAEKEMPQEEEMPREPPVPKRTQFWFRDTLSPGGSRSLSRLRALLPGGFWTALILGMAAWIACALPGGITAEGLRDAVGQAALERPVLFIALLIAALALGAACVGGALKTAARMAAIRALYEAPIPVKTARLFARRSRGRGWAAVLLATAGMELFLVTLFLIPLAWRGTSPWQEVLAFGGLAYALMSVGAFGLGGLAVQGENRDSPEPGSLGLFLASSLETLASATLNLALGLARFACFAGIAFLTWWLTCESIAWWGGENVQWLRWGLNTSLIPESETGLYLVASVLAALWFLLLVGLTLMYPLAHTLEWGVRCYLFARQKRDDIPLGQLGLSQEEAKQVQLAQRPPKAIRSPAADASPRGSR